MQQWRRKPEEGSVIFPGEGGDAKKVQQAPRISLMRARIVLSMLLAGSLVFNLACRDGGGQAEEMKDRQPLLQDVEVLDMVGSGKSRVFGVTFGNKIRSWIEAIRQDATKTPISLGQGEGRTQIGCDIIAPYSPSLCDNIKQAVTSEINIDSKGLADFLLFLLTGQLDLALKMTPLLGGAQLLWKTSFQMSENSVLHMYQFERAFSAAGGTAVTYGSVVSFGGGGGAGFQIKCGVKTLISAGGGGGGGLERSQGNVDYEGGGGGGVTIFPIELPGGVSIGCGSNGTVNRWDDGINLQQFLLYLPQVLELVRGCPPQFLRLHGGGGGGGGISLQASSDSDDEEDTLTGGPCTAKNFTCIPDTLNGGGSHNVPVSPPPASSPASAGKAARKSRGNVNSSSSSSSSDSSSSSVGNNRKDFYSIYGQGFKDLGEAGVRGGR
eukprot:jgi/Bigna1/83890/fgenesh1_pg.117_\